MCLQISYCYTTISCTPVCCYQEDLRALTGHEFPTGPLCRTNAEPFLILNPPPLRDSSLLQIAVLFTIPFIMTVFPSTFLIISFLRGLLCQAGLEVQGVLECQSSLVVPVARKVPPNLESHRRKLKFRISHYHQTR